MASSSLIALARSSGFTVSAEGESLAVETAGHQRHEDARRAHKRDYCQFFGLGYGYDVGAGVGHAGTTGLAHHSDGLTVAQSVEVVVDVPGVGVTVELEEGAVIDGELAVAGAKEAPGGAYVLDDEDAQSVDDVEITGREHIV